MVAQFIKLWPGLVFRLLKAQFIHSDDLRVRDAKKCIVFWALTVLARSRLFLIAVEN